MRNVGIRKSGSPQAHILCCSIFIAALFFFAASRELELIISGIS